MIKSMPECEEALRKLLGENEQLIWCGKPRQGFIFRASDIFKSLIALAMFVSSVFLLCFYLSSAYLLPFVFYLGGFTFVAMSSYWLLGRFFEKRNFRKKTCYGISSEHIFISFGSNTKKIKSFPLRFAIPEIPSQVVAIKDLPKIQLIPYMELCFETTIKESEKYSTIAFGLPPAYKSIVGDRGGRPAIIVETEFREIEEGKKVYEILMELRSNLQKVEPGLGP